MLDNLSIAVVLLAYLAVAANSIFICRRGVLWHRKVAVGVMIPSALFWAGFYGHVAYHDWFNVPTGASLAQWSRVGHTLTVAAFLAQQFLISRAHEDQMIALTNEIQRILKEPTDE